MATRVMLNAEGEAAEFLRGSKVLAIGDTLVGGIRATLFIAVHRDCKEGSKERKTPESELKRLYSEHGNGD